MLRDFSAGKLWFATFAIPFKLIVWVGLLFSTVSVAETPFLQYENGKKYQTWPDGRKYQIFVSDQGQFIYYVPQTRLVQHGDYLYQETYQQPYFADANVANNILEIYSREFPGGRDIPSHFRMAQEFYGHPVAKKLGGSSGFTDSTTPATTSAATKANPTREIEPAAASGTSPSVNHASALPNEQSQVAFVAYANREVFRSPPRVPIAIPAMVASNQGKLDELTKRLEKNAAAGVRGSFFADSDWCSLQFLDDVGTTRQCPEVRELNAPNARCYSQVVTNLAGWEGTVRNISSLGTGNGVCRAAARARSSACEATLNAPQAKSQPLFCRLETNRHPLAGQPVNEVPPLGDFSGKADRDFVAGQVMIEIPYASGTALPPGLQRLVNLYGLRILFDDGRDSEGSTNHQTRVIALSVPPQSEKTFCENMLGLSGEVIACGPNISTSANNDGTNAKIYVSKK